MRPGTSLARRLVTMTLGVAIGITAGLASITLAADRVESAHPVVFDATHLPPLHDLGRASRAGVRRALRPGRRRRGGGWVRRPWCGLRPERRTRAVRAPRARDSYGRRQPPARCSRCGRARRTAGRIRVLRRDRGTRARPAAHGSHRRCGCATRLSSAEAPGGCCPRPTRVRQPPTRGADCVRIVGRWRHAGWPRTGTRARHDRTVGFRRRRGRDTHRPRSGESPLSPLAQGRVHRLALRSP